MTIHVICVHPRPYPLSCIPCLSWPASAAPIAGPESTATHFFHFPRFPMGSAAKSPQDLPRQPLTDQTSESLPSQKIEKGSATGPEGRQEVAPTVRSGSTTTQKTIRGPEDRHWATVAAVRPRHQSQSNQVIAAKMIRPIRKISTFTAQMATIKAVSAGVRPAKG
jgi:hypothetical protein